LSYGEVNGEIAMYLSGDIDAVIMPLPVDPAEFLEVLEYEYEAPKKPVIEKPVPLYAPPTLAEILEAEREHPQKTAYIDHEQAEQAKESRPAREKKTERKPRARKLPRRIDIPVCYWTAYGKNGKQTWRYGTGD